MTRKKIGVDDRKADEGFARRWSRLKDEARRGDETVKPETPDAAVSGTVAQRAPDDKRDTRKAAVEKPPPVEAKDLPSIDNLTKDSDYTVFLREGVPEDLRRQALRKLWVSDPIMSAPDILDLHALDYRNVPTFPEGVKTLFKAGIGILDPTPETPPADEPGDGAVPAATPDAPPGDPSATAAGPAEPQIPPPIKPKGKPSA
ncbi:MAG: DUF3306 domain-containing protein [Rhodospirillales bacterium]|nr:DUF3306 domain-containing protein [Rhodospirillales bacterium]